MNEELKPYTEKTECCDAGIYFLHDTQKYYCNDCKREYVPKIPRPVVRLFNITPDTESYELTFVLNLPEKHQKD